MNRKFRAILTILAMVMGASFAMLGLTAPANASVPDTAATTTPGESTTFPEDCITVSEDGKTTQTCISGSASASSEASDIAVDILKINGRVVGEYLVKGGLTRHQIAGSRCWTSSAGWNTIRRSDGSIVKYWDTRNHRVCRTGVGPSGVQVVGCGNYYWPQSAPPRRYVTVRHPVVVKSFQNMKLTGRVHVSSTSFSTSVADASAVCVGGGSGSGHGKGTGSSTAASWLKFTFRNKAQMTARAAQVRSEFELGLNIKAYAEAKTNASSEADAKATCTPVWPPGDTDKAPSVNIGSEVCTAPGGTQGELTAASTNNDSVTRTLVFHLSGGPTSKPDVTKTVAAGDTVQVPFTGLAKGMYTVKVTVEETGLSASDSASIIDCAPPVYTAPSVSASAQACVAPGGATGVDIAGLNPNDVAAPGAFTLGSRSKDLGTVAANGTPSWTFNNVGIGTYTVGFALGAPINKTATTTVNVIECAYPAPLFMQFRQFNDLYKSLPEQPTTMDHCVTVDFPSGHSGSVFWEANRGSFATTTKPAQDGVQVCSTYTAPSESGTDTITVTATDSVSGKSVQKTSDPFTIKEWPAIP